MCLAETCKFHLGYQMKADYSSSTLKLKLCLYYVLRQRYTKFFMHADASQLNVHI